ncbi:MAG TPA: bifunctional riboflavin kinase/FAD synthetase, partial [Planctomycetota bacterium]|nr:bifunctional riboflavin kinase/FAD synthetase [Planctomycetota bacterium]
MVALGTFDGVHLGHRAILGTAVTHAREAGLQALACTFEQHPIEILQPARAPRSITTVEERLALIAGTGVDGVVVLSFT